MGSVGGWSSAHRLSAAFPEKIKWIQLARIDLDGSLLLYSSWGADLARAVVCYAIPCPQEPGPARARHTEQVQLMIKQKFGLEIISAPCPLPEDS